MSRGTHILVLHLRTWGCLAVYRTLALRFGLVKCKGIGYAKIHQALISIGWSAWFDAQKLYNWMTQTCYGEYLKILNTLTDLDYGDANDGRITASTAFKWWRGPRQTMTGLETANIPRNLDWMKQLNQSSPTAGPAESLKLPKEALLQSQKTRPTLGNMRSQLFL